MYINSFVIECDKTNHKPHPNFYLMTPQKVGAASFATVIPEKLMLTPCHGWKLILPQRPRPMTFSNGETDWMAANLAGLDAIPLEILPEIPWKVIHLKLIFNILPEMRAGTFSTSTASRKSPAPERQVLIEDRRKWVLKLLKCILKLGGCEREATWDKFLWASRQRSDEKFSGQQARNRLT